MDEQLLRRFSTTVRAIHAAALQPQGWTAALRAIAELQDAERVLLFTPAQAPQAGGFVMAHEIPESFLAEWSQRYLPHDIWTSEGMRQGVVRNGAVVLGEDLVPDAQLVQSVFYREFLSRMGIRRMCSGIVFDGGDPPLPLVSCAIFRSQQQVPYGAREREIQLLLTGHLSQALGAMLKLRDAQFRLATSLQALDRLPGAVLLLGPRGEVVFGNTAALELLARACGLALRAGDPRRDALGWLHASDADAQAALQAAIHQALAGPALRAAHFNQGVLIPRPHGRRDLVAQVAHCADSEAVWGDMRPSALLFLTDPQAHPGLDCALLQRLYHISAAESRVAQGLVEGLAPSQLALRLHLSQHTVKSHIKQLFTKTQTHRQAELIRLLLAFTQTRGGPHNPPNG